MTLLKASAEVGEGALGDAVEKDDLGSVGVVGVSDGGLQPARMIAASPSERRTGMGLVLMFICLIIKVLM